MTTDYSPDIRPGDEAAAAEQHTLSDREQATWNAEQELASAWANEARARAGYRARMEDTAQAIANARASSSAGRPLPTRWESTSPTPSGGCAHATTPPTAIPSAGPAPT